MNNKLDRDFGIFPLLHFTFPSILSLLFLSLYQMVDALFIANFIGDNALASVNIVYPVISVIIAVTMMFSSGGSAVVAKNMGEGKGQIAKENFTMIILAVTITSSVISLLVILFMEPMLTFLGSTPLLHDNCYAYLATLIPFMPLAALQMAFNTFFVTAGKPGIGLTLTVVSGLTNIVLDYVFIVLLDMGMAGSAWGTVAGYLIAAVPGILYCIFFRKGNLYFVRPKIRWRVIGFSCFNGSSEMIGNLSISVTTFLFNKITLEYMGEAGVTAISVILYAQFLLTAMFMGFISGTAPIFSFNLGRQHKQRLNALFRHSLQTVIVLTLIIITASYAFATPIVSIYIDESSPAFPIAHHGFLLFSMSYLFAGFNIYASGLFTALHNGKASAIISTLRTFVFLVIALLTLPRLMDADGIWLAVPIAELMSCIVAMLYLIRYRYEYFFTKRSISR